MVRNISNIGNPVSPEAFSKMSPSNMVRDKNPNWLSEYKAAQAKMEQDHSVLANNAKKVEANNVYWKNGSLAAIQWRDGIVEIYDTAVKKWSSSSTNLNGAAADLERALGPGVQVQRYKVGSRTPTRGDFSNFGPAAFKL